MSSIVKFFLFTYAVTWTFYFAAAMLQRASGSSDLPIAASILIFIGTISPSIVALSMTALTRGQKGLDELFARVIKWEVPLRWYVFAVTYMAAVKLAVALAHRMAVGAWPRFGAEPWFWIPLAIVFSTPVQAGEEIGWRGYALPRLAARIGYARGSILLGMIWGVWHAPLFFIPGADYEQSLPVFILAVTALSVAIAWLYMRTNGSLLLTMLMHSASNQIASVLRSPAATGGDPLSLSAPLTAWLTAAFLWIGAAYCLFRMRRHDAKIDGDLEVISKKSYSLVKKTQ